MFKVLTLGREFRAIFISTLEKTEDDGSTSNSTKSICDRYVFNTVITRAQSLVVCVGNPFLLFSIEKLSGYKIHCWREYVKRCLEASTLSLALLSNETGVQDSVHKLYIEVFGDLRDMLSYNYTKDYDAIDSILQAYKKAFQTNKACEDMEIMFGKIDNGDLGYVVQKKDPPITPKETPNNTEFDDTLIECYLESTRFNKCTAIPLNLKEKPIIIQGVDNRHRALDGAQVKVHVYKDSDRLGCVHKVVKQGPQRQFVCNVDSHNSVFFLPIDQRTPKLANLPPLTREMFTHVSDGLIIKNELKYKRRAVTIFDPKSFTIPTKPYEEMKIPEIKDVIPLSIAQKLLFVVWYLGWTPKYRYPLGVVIGAIPKGLTLYHGERLLLAHHHINTAPVDEVAYAYKDETILVPTTTSSLPHYDNAFTIDPPEAMELDDALTLEPVASDDGKCYQLGVHITNVGRAVQKGSEVDVNAQNRATAVYVSKLHPKHYPLLPEKVRKTLSLNCDTEKSTISYTCQVRVDHDGNCSIVAGTIKICESLVQSRAQLTYEEVQHSLAGVNDVKLDEKIIRYNKTLSNNEKFGLQQRLALLLRISESFLKDRIKYDGADYSIEDVNQQSSPQAYFLVKELMIWANRIAAECLLPAFPQLSVLCRQKPPNQERLKKALEKYDNVVAHSPAHKALADNLNIKINIESKPFIIMEILKKQLYEALQSNNFVQAKNLLRTTNYHPQFAVLCKELNSTKCRAEYICSSMLQQQKPLSIKSGSYMISLPQDKSEVYSHNDLACLYTSSTSPLRKYIDIVVQRLILQHLSPPTSATNLDYSEKYLNEICEISNTKTLNAKQFKTELDCFGIALSLAQCSQPCTVYVANIDKNVNLVFQELDFAFLSLEQRSFHFTSITSNTKSWATKTLEKFGDSESCRTHVWKARVTSFDSKLAVNQYWSSSKKCQTGLELNEADAIITFLLREEPSEGIHESILIRSKSSLSTGNNQTVPLVKHCYKADFPAKSMSLGREDYVKVEDFMKRPSRDTANALKDLLSSFQSSSGSDSNDMFPQEASFFLYEIKRSFKLYESFKVWLTANYNDHILSPCIQLLELAPMLNVCVQHSTKPADCFSSPILSHASKVKYNDIHEYIELWESVLLAEAAVQSVGEAEIQLIQNVPLEWPELRQPGSSLDDVHYSPLKEGTELADITLTVPAEFEERCGEYFDLQVGNLVCARYNIPLGEEKEVNGRRVTTASAVYHFVIHQIEEPDDNERHQTVFTTKKRFKKQNAKKRRPDNERQSNKVIHMKFASKDIARVSPFMGQYIKDTTCEIQVIPLSLSYRYIPYNTKF